MGLFSRKPRPARTVRFVQDPQGTPAVDFTKHRAGHVSLTKKADKAGLALSALGLAGVRAQMRVYIDHSGSMEFERCLYYTNGTVQTTVERTLGYGFQLVTSGVISVSTFDDRIRQTVDVSVDNYSGVVNRELWKPNIMGGTNYAPVLRDVLEAAKVTDEPIIAVIGTDGCPSDKDRARQLICELSRYPVWFKFLAFEQVPFLSTLDDLEETNPGERLVDNVDSKFFDGNTWPRIKDISDLQFAQAMADEWTSWIEAATKAGILTR